MPTACKISKKMVGDKGTRIFYNFQDQKNGQYPSFKVESL
jgi:hypothetical protein